MLGNRSPTSVPGFPGEQAMGHVPTIENRIPVSFFLRWSLNNQLNHGISFQILPTFFLF